MRDVRGWLVLAGLAAIVAVLLALGSNPQGSPEHNTNSDAKNGASAVRYVAQSLGRGGDQIAGSFDLSKAGLLFVFSPTSPFTGYEAQQLHDWVNRGGVLVFASETGDDQLDSAFGVRRSNDPTRASGAYGVEPLKGVAELSGGAFVYPFALTTNQVAIVRDRRGLAMGYVENIGTGRAVVLADPLELCNGYLDQAANSRMLVDLLALAPPGARVAFDEYHHGFTVGDVTPRAWLLTPWGAGLAWLVVAVFVGLVLRGRGFGPRIPLQPGSARAAAEWTSAVGALLRRAGGRKVTLDVLATATQRAVAARLGIPVEPHERMQAALEQRAPELAAALAGADRAIATSAATRDASLLDTARRLHRIAYPFTEPSKEKK